MNILTRSQSVGVFALLCAVAAIGLYGFVLRYIRGSMEELERVRMETAALERRTDTRDAIRAAVRKTERARTELTGYLLATKDRTRFLDLVEQELSAEAGVSVEVEKLTERETSVAGLPQVKDAPTVLHPSAQRYVEIVLQVAGSWEGMCTYLAYLEALPYVFWIESASLEAQADGTESGGWTGSVRARIAVQ